MEQRWHQMKKVQAGRFQFWRVGRGQPDLPRQRETNSAVPGSHFGFCSAWYWEPQPIQAGDPLCNRH